MYGEQDALADAGAGVIDREGRTALGGAPVDAGGRGNAQIVIGVSGELCVFMNKAFAQLVDSAREP